MIVRAQISFPFDSALPRDVLTITPHFESDDPSSLIQVLKTNLLANSNITATGIFTIKLYDALKAKPSYPLVQLSQGTGFKTSTTPRELALCLSYYAGANRPRQRGRLYIPAPFLGGSMNVKPTSTQITDALNWRKIFTDGMLANNYWVLFSRLNKTQNRVTNAWVDDEWDVMRSRGLRSSSRQSATVP